MVSIVEHKSFPGRTIQSLSQGMINKIAAGEVIERPASVLKELVENSIDAGATRIDLTVDEGGASLMRVVDNGCGIAPDQLTLALSPHATSKIVDVDDLFQIRTFGFRGEALASIAEISQMSLKSRTPEYDEGTQLQSNGGTRTEPSPCGMPIGSQIEVRNLFFNTPVRRKYMKSTTTEFGHICEAFVRLVLPQPKIHFTLKHNGRVVHDLPPEESMLARIRQIFGEDVSRDMIQVQNRPDAPVYVHGLVSHPNHSRSNNRMQYFFLNNRFIRDRALQHALTEAYRGILTVGRFPCAFLRVEMSPNMFDVNVHPTKMEVRFLDSNKVYAGFLGTIREKFLSSDLNGQFTRGASDKGQSDQGPSRSMGGGDPNDPRAALADSVTEQTRLSVLDWVNEIEKSSSDSPKRQSPADRLSLHTLPDRSSGHGTTALPQGISSQGKKSVQVPFTSDTVAAPSVGRRNAIEFSFRPVTDRVAHSPSGKLVVQMLNRYLVMETAQGIAVVDQHALHERILFEQLKSRMEEGRLEAQRLLVPVPVDLAPEELTCVQENSDFFKTLGLWIEPFGGGTVLISAFPAILARTPPAEILLAMIEPILEAGKKPVVAELLDTMLHSMACKAAVKAGDRLHSDSMAKLIELAEREVNAHHCPHGRPSTIIFSVEEIDKMFRRS